MKDEFTFIIGGPLEFSYGEIEYKGEKNYYITGYISTKDLDLVNDIVTEECLQDLVEQINGGNVKLDADHEAWRNGDEGPNILPVGKIVEAKYDAEGKRVWVKAVINKNSTRFKNIWGSIKDKFLDAFSIAYRPIDTAIKMVGETQVRLLKKVQLLNVALTGNPANPDARIATVFAKSLSYMEDKNMEQEQPKEEPVVEKVEEAEEEHEENPLEAEVKALKDQLDKVSNFEEELKNLKKQLGERDAEVKSLKEQLEKPQFKALAEEAPKVEQKKEDSRVFTPMNLV